MTEFEAAADTVLIPATNKEWFLRLEFGKSSSREYATIVQNANKWPKYQFEKISEQYEMHKLTFAKDEILEFEKIYEKVKDWKSTKVFIMDEYIVKRDLSRWLICYRDKLKNRQSNPYYCYGASMFTENIFGCHRALFRERDPETWYEVGVLQHDGTFVINRKQLLLRVIGNLQVYKLCPAFSAKAIKKAFELIPATINPKRDKLWEYQGDARQIVTGVRPIGIEKRLGIKGNENEGVIFTVEYGMGNVVSPQFIKIISELKGISEKDYMLERVRSGHYACVQSGISVDSDAEKGKASSGKSGCLIIGVVMLLIFFMASC